MQHEAEYERLVERLPDYQEFLRYGHVARRTEQPEEWRREMRRNARADRITIRTFAVESEDGGWDVYASRARDASIEELVEAMKVVDVVMQAQDRASLLGHRARWVRSLEGRSAGLCVSCGARIYVDTNTSPPTMEGEAFETECSSRPD